MTKPTVCGIKMQGSETRDSRAHTTRWRQHLNPTRLWTRSATEDVTRSTEHGAHSSTVHPTEAQALSLTRTPTRHDKKLLVPHTRTQSPEPGETVNPLPEYIYAVAHRVPRAPGGQPERISPRESALRLSVNAYGLRVVSGSPHHDWHRDRGLCLRRALPVAKQALSAYPQQTRVKLGYTAGVTVQSKSPGFPPVQCASRHLFTHTYIHTYTVTRIMCASLKKTINPPVHIISKSSMHWQRKVAEGHNQS